MFTLKFYRRYDSGQEQEFFVTCPRFELIRLGADHFSVMVYPDHAKTNQVEYHIGGESCEAYDTLYVENLGGKTIHRLTGARLA